jgi:hypothetical protein
MRFLSYLQNFFRVLAAAGALSLLTATPVLAGGQGISASDYYGAFGGAGNFVGGNPYVQFYDADSALVSSTASRSRQTNGHELAGASNTGVIGCGGDVQVISPGATKAVSSASVASSPALGGESPLYAISMVLIEFGTDLGSPNVVLAEAGTPVDLSAVLVNLQSVLTISPAERGPALLGTALNDAAIVLATALSKPGISPAQKSSVIKAASAVSILMNAARSAMAPPKNK